MDDQIDQLEAKLASLKSGAGLDSLKDGAGADQFELLELASTLSAFQPPLRQPETIAEQLNAVLAAAESRPAAPASNAPLPKPAPVKQLTWLAPFAAASGVLVLLLACLSFISLGLLVNWGGSWVLNRQVEGKASVQAVRGVLELQKRDGSWVLVGEEDRLEPGARLRTRSLSSADLLLRDGSLIHLGPLSEIVIEQIDWSWRGLRVVRLTQWSGLTEHQVAPSTRTGSLYEVRTPAATTTAVGTAFTIQVDPQLGTLLEVAQGIVNITAMGATLPVTPGWVTSVALGQPPSQPALSLHGEGIMVGDPAAWTIAGQGIVFKPGMQELAEFQSGDLVAFAGRQLADGTLQVNQLVKLLSPQLPEFKLNGPIEAAAPNALVAAETVINVDASTLVSASHTSGGAATVEGLILEDETWLATRVYSPDNGQPFQFTGIVQSITAETWWISGLEVQVNDETAIPAEILQGDLTQVQGWILDDSTWLAESILPILPAVASFDYTGTVESTSPWVVAGVPLETRVWTAIDLEIEPGDQVRVRGPILEDGIWVAASIEKNSLAPEEVTLELVGAVNSLDPWVVSGILLVVDDQTEIIGEIQQGSLVSAYLVRQSNGNWYTERISLVEPGPAGCVTYSAVASAIEGNLLTLQNGSNIDLDTVELVEGNIQVGNTLLVVQCQEADGTFRYPLVKVLAGPPGEPTYPPTPTPTVTLTPPPESLILPNCYKISYLGFDDHADGTSTWHYSVEELSCAQDLSNWVLEVPFCARPVSASPSPWEEVHPDPNLHLNGIKWDVGAGFERGEFSVVLSGELSLGITQVGAKGPDIATGFISGPVCDVATATPTHIPTQTLTPTLTSTPTVTLTPMPTGSPTVTPTPSPTPTSTMVPPVVSGMILITDNDQTLMINCSGAAVEVRGNANHITLQGICSSLTIRGNANWISIQSSPSLAIVDTGNENQVVQR
jgi:hypothetical protein